MAKPKHECQLPAGEQWAASDRSCLHWLPLVKSPVVKCKCGKPIGRRCSECGKVF